MGLEKHFKKLKYSEKSSSPNNALLASAIERRHLTTKESSQYLSNSAEELLDILRHQFGLTEEELLTLLNDSFGYRIVSVKNLVPDPGLVSRWPLSFLQDAALIPLYEDNTHLCIVTHNPFHPTVEEIRKKTPKTLKLFLANWHEINQFWLSKQLNSTPTHLLDIVVNKALEKNASDIHVYQTQSGSDVQYRSNGLMYPLLNLNATDTKELTRLIKYHANMDIAQWTKPQDGRIRHTATATPFDIRVAAIPSAHGEDFALRLLAETSQYKTLDSLGLSAPAHQFITDILNQNWGLILVTGPTGSGKTTTLYSCLRQLSDTRKQNIVTLEDPIESVLPGIRQTQINPAAGYTFDSALKSILRHDPDIILVGEIRDAETANIALQAAYTGHLVLASLHTPNCESTLLRLANFDLDPFLVTHSLKAIISQKLHPIDCPICINARKTGCPSCHFTGLSRRELLTEILRINTPCHTANPADQIAALLKTNPYHSFDSDEQAKQDPCGTPQKH